MAAMLYVSLQMLVKYDSDKLAYSISLLIKLFPIIICFFFFSYEVAIST